MGFALSTFYLFVAYLGTETVFGPLAPYRLEFVLALSIFLVSLPLLPTSNIIKSPQSLALIGLGFAVPFSVAVSGWIGGALQAFNGFIPCAFAYFLVCLHCNSKKKLIILIVALEVVCFFVILKGSLELRAVGGDAPSPALLDESSYLLAQRSDQGEWFYRLRGQHFMNDPNDFAQFLVCMVPMAFALWRPKKTMRNIGLVILPVCILLYGAFLTHSRGSLLALVVLAAAAARKRIGRVASLITAGAIFMGASVLGFTGGREISAESGSDRTALWSSGLQLLKSHPLFGVGFGRMPDYTGLTAHNSIVVCAAELGITGLFFWSLFVLPSIRDAMAIASPLKVHESEPMRIVEPLVPSPPLQSAPIERTEINRLGGLVLLSLIGFLVTGWFLSRAYAMTLFLLGGIAEVIFQIAADRGMIAPRLQLGPALRYSGMLAVSLILAMYVLLRVTNLTR
ncbi:MAG TPA: O-antigen ligase family protein [Terracidiphilus sp.]